MKVVFQEVKSNKNFRMDPLERCISNLSGCRTHYEKLNHEMLVLKKIKCYLLSFMRGYQACVPLSSKS
jgi:hypothetical protein